MPANEEISHDKKKRKSKYDYCEEEMVTLEPWAPEEEFNLILAHKVYQNHWSKISSALKARTPNMIKNKFYSIFRKVKSKMHRNDFKFSCKLELLEMHYMSSLIERYLQYPVPNIKQKGKRGKDFIFTLISNVSKYAVHDYKNNLIEKTKAEGTIDALFEDLKIELKSTLSINIAKSVTKGQNIEARQNEKKKIKSINEAPPKLPSLPSTSYFDKMKQDVKPLANVFAQQWENSQVYDYNTKSPQFIFSPASFSAGPVVNPAVAMNSAYFMPIPLPSDGFTELSNNVKNLQLPLPINRATPAISPNIEGFYPIPQQMMSMSQDLQNKRYSASPLPDIFSTLQVSGQAPYGMYNPQINQQPNF